MSDAKLPGADGPGSTEEEGGLLDPSDTFAKRHIGPDDASIGQMLQRVGCDSLANLCDETVPASIRLEAELELGDRSYRQRTALDMWSKRAGSGCQTWEHTVCRSR